MDRAQTHEFEEEIKKIEWNVIGTSEIKREGEDLEKSDNGNYIYIYYYDETKGYREQASIYIRE